MLHDMLHWSLIPATLVYLGGLLVRRVRPGPEGRPYFAFYLLAVAAGLMGISVAATFVSTPQGPSLGIFLLSLSAPVIIGVLALLLQRLPDLWQLPGRWRLAVVFFTGIVILAGLNQLSNYLLHYVFGTLVLALILRLVKKRVGYLVLISLAGLAYLILMDAGALESLMGSGPGLGVPLMILSFGIPYLLVGLAAALVLRIALARAEADDPQPAWLKLLYLSLAGLLIGYLTYRIYWSSIWDQTSDGLGGIFLSLPGMMMAVAAGLAFSFYLRGWRRLGGAAFALIVPLLFSQAFQRGWDVSYHELTETRAGQIEQALERYHADQGSYPSDLNALSPGYLLQVPEPVILRRVGWCYRAGSDHYRLGTYHREYFSLPISFRMYAQAGNPPDEWACEEKLAFVQERYSVAPYFQTASPAQFTGDTGEPLPPSQPSTGRNPLSPIDSAQQVQYGTWSQDGRYLLYSAVEGEKTRYNMHLYLYDSGSGETCRTGQAHLQQYGLYNQHAWLPGGNLLYIDILGRIYLLEACQPGQSDLSGLFGEVVAEPTTEADLEAYIRTKQTLLAYDPASGRALVNKQDRFWILEAERGTAEPLEMVTPNPFELHWDNAAFSPNGEQLAIARLNGRDGREGTTLYLLDPGSREIIRELALDYATSQSAPWLEWQNENELLIHGGEAFSIIDLRTDPPSERRVIEDIFGLAIRYPDDAASMASLQIEDGSYRIAFRANHPRNQAIYIFSSTSEQVQTLHPEEDALLIFSPEVSSPLPQFENGAANRDNHMVYWPDQPEREPLLLEVEGHSPRAYARLSVRLMPERGLAAFGSSQGVSLHDLNSGQMLAFYELQGDSGSQYVSITAAPGETALMVVAERGGLYRVPLP